MNLVLVSLAGALGALARYGIEEIVELRRVSWRPYGTMAVNALANPQGMTVQGGSATATVNGSQLTITTSQNASLNWQSFNIGSKAQVDFFQPRTQSVALNRVLSADPSSIYGTLRANGGVFLVNPSGIIFGKGSSVNVGSLVASTMSISDGNFNSGNYRFQRNGSTASIINKGKIQAAEGGLMKWS